MSHPTPLPAAFAPVSGASKYPVYRDRWDYWGPRIRGCESWGDPSAPPNYQAENRASGASGAYQFLDTTWDGRYGVPKARMATPDQQERTAFELFQAQGTRPWNASYPCWKGQPPVARAPAELAGSSPPATEPSTTSAPPTTSTTAGTATTTTSTTTTTTTSIP